MSESDYVEKFVALNMGKVKSSKNDYVLPGEPLTQKEFERMIRDAEKGPFYSLQTLKDEISKWKAKHSK
jgi:hypothetical protein